MKKPYPLLLLFYLFFIILFASCKRDMDAKPLQVSLSKTGLQRAFIRLSPDPSNFNIAVKLDGFVSKFPERSISFHVEPSLLTSFNFSSGNHFDLLPDST